MNRLNCKIFLVCAHIPIIDQYFRSAYELYRNSISDDKRNVDAKKPEKPFASRTSEHTLLVYGNDCEFKLLDMQ